MIQERETQCISEIRSSSHKEYDKIKIEPTSALFIHKDGFHNTEVFIVEARKKVHCWRLNHVDICQYLPEQGTKKESSQIQKLIHCRIEFNGELIFTLLPQFNEILCREIKEMVPYHSEELKKWLKQPITNIFKVSTKGVREFGFRHSFLEIQSIYKHHQDKYYFRRKKWEAEEISMIQEIQTEDVIEADVRNLPSVLNEVQKLLSAPKEN